MAKKKGRKPTAEEQRLAVREARSVYVTAILTKKRDPKREIIRVQLAHLACLAV